MKERPILFSAPMVRALREGRKTQTRRVMKPQPPDWIDSFGYTAFTPEGSISGRGYWKGVPGEEGPGEKFFKSPHGMRGDRLWVRETFFSWRTKVYSESGMTEGAEQAVYRADGGCLLNGGKWKPSIFMPRWASRLTLEITEVRVQRLQECSEVDAVAEGIDPLFSSAEVKARPELHHDPMPWRNYLWHGDIGRSITAKQSTAWRHQYSSYDTPTDSYSSLWESINGTGSWDANPWVWALTFKVVA